MVRPQVMVFNLPATEEAQICTHTTLQTRGESTCKELRLTHCCFSR